MNKNLEDGSHEMRVHYMMPVNESTSLLNLLPIDSRRSSIQNPLQHLNSMSLSYSFSPYFYRKYFYISHGGMAASAFNLASSILGAGTLALPYALYHSGLVLSFVALLVCALATIYSVYLLACLMEITGRSTYEEMSLYCFGPTIEKFTAFVIVLFCWGVAVIYIVVIGDILDSIIIALKINLYISRQTVLLMFWIFIMLPLSLQRNINSLRYASLVGALSTMVLVAAIFTHAFKNEANISSLPLVKFKIETISSFNTFVFSICCQSVVSKVYSEMRRGTPCRITTAAALSTGSCCLMYLVAGVFGAANFGSLTEPNVMHNYTNELDTPYIGLAFFAMALTVTMAFPMTIFPTRDSVLSAFGYPDDEPAYISYIVSTILAFLALLLGILVPNVRILFDVLGGVFGSFVSFIFPAAFALRCGYWNPYRVGWGHTFATTGLLILGLVSCGLGLYSSLRNT